MSQNQTTNTVPPMRLHAAPPRVTRLSRKVLASVGAVALVGVGGALIYALQTRDGGNSSKELYSTTNRQPADGLAGLPRDYTGPILGPPLPGDLGRPIVDAQNRGQPVVPPTITTPRVDEAEQRRLAEEEAARTSRVFFQTAPGASTAAAPQAGMTMPNFGGFDLNGQRIQPTAQDKQLAFLNAAVDRRTTSSDRVMPPASPFVLQAGAVIPAALITGIRSDLPGQITAQVTENIYDSPTGRILLVPQGMGDDPMHVMMRQVMALFDEYQSKENAKHVLRAMNENARQGFWNGALPPIGYRIVAAEQRGSKTKKKLEIDPLHADTVRLIYRLFLEGDGTSGTLGVKAITCYLNERRMFTRDGGRWGLAQIHAILTRTTYIGEHRFNTRSHKDRERKPESEVAIMEVPPLIDRETFDAVQARLKSRNPMVTPARISSGPTLLTGICFCAKCGGAMTLRTGRSSTGATYRYYTCSTKARQGKTGCEGRTIPMDRLDHLVAGHIEERLLQPKRLETILSSVIDRRQERTERRREHLTELHRRITDTDQRLGRLYDAIESGTVDKDDPALKERIAGLQALRDQAKADAERTQLALDSAGNQSVSPDMLKAFARRARERIQLDNGGYRRDHLRALAQRVEVADTEVRIMGSKSELLRTLVAASSVQSAAFGVQSSVLKWRARKDSNL